VYDDGAYETEIVDTDGTTVALFAAQANEIEPAPEPE
jgi:hypothetical protein